MAIHEHIHVISGGGSVGQTYPRMIRELKGITDTVIVSNSLEGARDKEKIIAEFETVKELSEKMGIQYMDPIYYKQQTFQEIIDTIIELYEKHPKAEFSFNITGGTKIQALALYRVADLMDASVYYVSENPDEVTLLTKCRLPAKDIGKNPNIPVLLDLISKKPSGIARVELKQKMSKVYVPIRNRGKEEHILKEGTFSVMLGQLLDWNLIEEGHENKRNKTYQIKSEGKIMLKLYNISTSE